jgi:Ulp1 family protease
LFNIFGGKKDFIIFHTFFVQDLVEKSVEKLITFEREVKIFSGFKKILFPHCIPGHWICNLIDIEKKEIQTFDSLSSPKQTTTNKKIQNFFLMREIIEKKIEIEIEKEKEKDPLYTTMEKSAHNKAMKQLAKGLEIEFLEPNFNIIEPNKKYIEQKNGFDCGLFVIFFIFNLAFNEFDIKNSINQSNMATFRKYLLEIIILLLEDNNLLK